MEHLLHKSHTDTTATQHEEVAVCLRGQETIQSLSSGLKQLSRGERRQVITFHSSTPPSIHLYTHTHHELFPTSVKHRAILLSFIAGKSLWILIALLGGIWGQRERPNMAKAEQKWNFDLTEGRIIPG